MKERPILFSGEMVRAILDRCKTQTRRIVKPQHIPATARTLRWENQDAEELTHVARCPFGSPGDRLWVKESFLPCNGGPCKTADASYVCLRDGTQKYRRGNLIPWGDGPPPKWEATYHKFKPSIHMPRWASRLTLEIVAVRVERLQAISGADAAAEGCPEMLGGEYAVDGMDSRVVWFRDLWERINGRGSWAANPWVWVVEFKRATP